MVDAGVAHVTLPAAITAMRQYRSLVLCECNKLVDMWVLLWYVCVVWQQNERYKLQLCI
jgi:hypothetical protein